MMATTALKTNLTLLVSVAHVTCVKIDLYESLHFLRNFCLKYSEPDCATVQQIRAQARAT